MKVDYKTLRETCLNPIESFESLGEVYNTPDGIYIYKDNGADVLAVAHLDTVLGLDHFHVMTINGDKIVINSQLDDRLGAYTLIHLLPAMGIKYDLLLTEGEEQGRSTAAHFKTSKKYNWMFSFDRRGEDVVLYQYESKVINEALKSSKFRIGQGTFSDIAFLDHLGCSGFNVGTGYHGEHSDMCYANMREHKSQVKRFVHFYNHNKDTYYKYEHIPYSYGSHYPLKGSRSFETYNWERWGEYDDLYCYLCAKTRGTVDMGNGIWVCEACLGQCEYCAGCDDLILATESTDGLCEDCDRHARSTEDY